MKNTRRTIVRLVLTCVCAMALSTANLGCVVALGRCGSCAMKMRGCPHGRTKACCQKASAKCKKGCTKACCKKASAKCKKGCTKPCCKKA